ncbi:MAG: amidotransferase [Deltaproteobacteria bacterium]|nr:MAG: amidotransferase [Deltaproteobacteria bacterium]
MRLHLLEHDPNDMSHTNMTMWAERKGYQITHTYVCRNEALPAVDDFDWLMIMGGSPHVWEEERHPWMAAEKAFIAAAIESGKPMLGICFGAQLLAEALGGRVFPSDQEEIGWYDVTLTPEGRRSFLFEDIPECFLTFHWHSDHFSLPSGCIRLAKSDPTANQAFVCEGHPFVGVQFHPEYTREMVTYFAHEEGHGWKQSRFVAGPESVLVKTDTISDTYWLMASLLDNMERKFIQNA